MLNEMVIASQIKHNKHVSKCKIQYVPPKLRSEDIKNELIHLFPFATQFRLRSLVHEAPSVTYTRKASPPLLIYQ